MKLQSFILAFFLVAIAACVSTSPDDGSQGTGNTGGLGINPEAFCTPNAVIHSCGDYIISDGVSERVIYDNGDLSKPRVCDINNPSAECADAIHTSCEKVFECPHEQTTKPAVPMDFTKCEEPRSDACTREYVPVCAELSDGSKETFSNGCSACANEDVVGYDAGACEVEKEFFECNEPRPEVCTMQYDPVCATVDTGIRCITAPCPSTEQKTYGNGCSACGDKNVLGFTKGDCEGEFGNDGVVLDEPIPTDMPVDGKPNIGDGVARPLGVCDFAPEFARDYFICVDECPQGMDNFTTQTGIIQCIDALDTTYFENLPTCFRSSSSCECTFIPRTTSGEEIDVGYRCLDNQDYESFLIFSSGLCKKDEFGQESCAIA